MARRLCSRCLGSFEEPAPGKGDHEPVCEPCRALAARAPATTPAAPPAAEVAERGWLGGLRLEAVESCRGRSWVVRAPVLLYLAYALVRHWTSPMYQDWFKPLDLGVHELGHFLFRPLGQFLSIAGGSLTQCLLPFGSIFMFRRQADWFAIAVCLGWLGLNLFDVATYAADARSMSLPLVSPGGGEVYHDWNYLLEALGLLRFDGAIAFLMRLAATALMLGSLGLGAWLLREMARSGPGRAID